MHNSDKLQVRVIAFGQLSRTKTLNTCMNFPLNTCSINSDMKTLHIYHNQSITQTETLTFGQALQLGLFREELKGDTS